MPDGITAEEYIAKYVAVAKAARTVFPDIKIVGPVFNNEWQWYNWQNDERLLDPVSNKRYCWGEYFIKRIAEEQERANMRLIDVLDFHFYPEFKPQHNARDITLQLHRVFYDTGYDFPLANGVKVTGNYGWDENITQEYIWKRSMDWLDLYMGEGHGVTMGLSEYGSYYAEDPNVIAVNYASMLGTFAENDVEIFSVWEWDDVMWEVMHLFTRYAGTTSVASVSSDEVLVSAYSSINDTKDTVSVVLVNRDVDNYQHIAVNLENIEVEGASVPYYQLSNLPVLPAGEKTFVSATENALVHDMVMVTGSSFELSVPELSITLVRIPLENETSGNQKLSASPAFNLYPNPTTGQTTVKATGLEGDVRIDVMDITGRVLNTVPVSPVNGHIATTLDVSDLGKGVYFIRLSNKDLQVNRKLIVR